MLDWVLIILTIATGAGAGDGAQTASVSIGEGVVVGESVFVEDETAAGGNALLAGTVKPQEDSGFGEAEEAPQFQAEPQTPTGKFTTAGEIKQLMELTKPNWVAISAQPGNDFLYVTQIWSWRCGLLQMKVSLNGGPAEEWPLPPCHTDTNAPNAIIESDGLPFKMYGAGEIETMEVELLYDDLSTTSASYTRKDIVMP